MKKQDLESQELGISDFVGLCWKYKKMLVFCGKKIQLRRELSVHRVFNRVSLGSEEE